MSAFTDPWEINLEGGRRVLLADITEERGGGVFLAFTRPATEGEEADDKGRHHTTLSLTEEAAEALFCLLAYRSERRTSPSLAV